MNLNKSHNRTGGMASTMLSMPSGWGLTVGALSFCYDSIFKGRVPLHLIIIGIERGCGYRASSYSYIQD